MNADSLVVEGKCIGLSQKAHVEFIVMADIIEVSLKRLQKIEFMKNIPPNCTLFAARDFAAADPPVKLCSLSWRNEGSMDKVRVSFGNFRSVRGFTC